MPASSELVANPCRALCDWRQLPARAGGRAGGPRLFGCRGCGSQWQPGLAWTPAQADGRVPDAVRQALDVEKTLQDGADLTSGPGEAPAGSSGS